MRRPRNLGWYVTFVVVFLVIFVVIYLLTGHDALGATVRFVWSGISVALDALASAASSFLVLIARSTAFAFEGLANAMSSLVGLIARGLGWGRLRGLSRAVAGIGMGYAAGVVLSDNAVRHARGWRHKLMAAARAVGGRWERLPFVVKLGVVVALIASQIYLGWLLIVFPMAFIVPVVRRAWAQLANVMFSGWYRKRFGVRQRALVSWLRRLPGVRSVIGGIRLLRIRYLCAWRLWRYHPRYQKTGKRTHRVSVVEPIRLWRGGELDAYVGRPLLAGPKRNRQPAAEASPENSAGSPVAGSSFTSPPR